MIIADDGEADTVADDDGADDADDDDKEEGSDGVVYPECKDEKDRKPHDHCVQQARRLLHLDVAMFLSSTTLG